MNVNPQGEIRHQTSNQIENTEHKTQEIMRPQPFQPPRTQRAAEIVSPTVSDNRKVSSDEDTELSRAEASLLQKVVRKGLIESKHDIEVQRKDPTSPLYSVKTFEALHL